MTSNTPPDLSGAVKPSSQDDGVVADAAAQALAHWLGYLWGGLRDDRIADRGFKPWGFSGLGHKEFQGGKQDLRDIVNEIVRLAHPPSQGPGEMEKAWRDHAKSHLSASEDDDCEIGGEEWSLHREAARIYTKCADDLAAPRPAEPTSLQKVQGSAAAQSAGQEQHAPGVHPVEALWRECGLPEYFLGNGGTNTKLYDLYERIRSAGQGDDYQAGWHVGYAEGLDLGLRSRSPLAPADLWQDIATAPKDGTEILGLDEEGRRRVASWVGGWSQWQAHPGRYTFRATCWQPLPAAPARIPPDHAAPSGKVER